MSDINYTKRIDSLKARYNPENTRLFESRVFSETLGLSGDTSKYVRMAMMAVDDDYTRKSKQAGEMAKEHLKKELTNVDFEYQGSVMTDTHIKGASDIDLLVLCTKFNHTEINKVRSELKKADNYTYTERQNLQLYEKHFSLYEGNCNADLRQLRSEIERVMMATYKICDTSKPKSVKITNQSLHRDVDVVTACWYDTFYYVLHGEQKIDRAISIYDKEKDADKGPDYPFLSIDRINSRSAYTNGRLKRMIRFLKNVRTDSDRMIDLSSFEINAICYNISTSEYINSEYKQLVYLLWNFMYHLHKDGTASQLRSVVGDEKVFTSTQKIESLKNLEDEVWNIYQDLSK